MVRRVLTLPKPVAEQPVGPHIALRVYAFTVSVIISQYYF
jgi:hypothetical protein